MKKIMDLVLQGRSDNNLTFVDICALLKGLGFEERIRGDHYIFTRHDVEEIINIQPKGSKTKAYQVKQIEAIILKYKLGAEGNGAIRDNNILE